MGGITFGMNFPWFRSWRRRLVVVGLLFGASLIVAQAAESGGPATAAPTRLKRSESFLGIHFDFHAGPDCTEVGKNTTREMILGILDQVKPDYLQVDCKGHAGFTSYPTRVGNPAPGFVGDPLKLWRQVTAERGVSLYMHYSGIWDAEAVRIHPDWAVVQADGKPSPRLTSPFGPYREKLLVPQLQELAGVYGVDGVWVDGECWATAPDYGDAAVRAFRDATGIQEIPKNSDSPNWNRWQDFHREAFRRYLRAYVTEMKRSHPRFEVASNWAFSDHMPEPVSADVAFLSGDFSPQNSLNSARFSARCLQDQGLPWDLMSWAFSAPQKRSIHPLKTAVQLQQEAAVVLAQGGGYQAYFQQKRDGSIHDWQMQVMAEVARFCRARQAFCHRAAAVPQVALLYSRAAHYRSASALFGPWGTHGIQALKGVLQCLLDSQNSVQILSEHHLSGHMSQWPLIVVPEWDYLEPAFREELAAYVRGGGNLLLVSWRSASLFLKELEVEPVGDVVQAGRFLERGSTLGGFETRLQGVRLGASSRAVVLGRLHHSDDRNSPSEVAATVTPVGNGRIGALWFDFGDPYLTQRLSVSRDLFQDVVRALVPNPKVEVTGSHFVDVSLARNHDRLLVNLVNTAGPHELEKEYVFDSIPPVGPLEVRLRLGRKPRSVVAQPENRKLSVQWKDGVARVTLPRLEIHTALVVEE